MKQRNMIMIKMDDCQIIIDNGVSDIPASIKGKMFSKGILIVPQKYDIKRIAVFASHFESCFTLCQLADHGFDVKTLNKIQDNISQL